jgi:hypothetical protein
MFIRERFNSNPEEFSTNNSRLFAYNSLICNMHKCGKTNE